MFALVPDSYRVPEHPRREPSFPRLSLGDLGLNVALASFSMLFGASLVGYAVTRAQSATWKTAAMPDIPWGTALSTLLLIACSFTFRLAEDALTKNRREKFRFEIQLTLALGILFLLTQVVNWVLFSSARPPEQLRNLYVFTFYLLTGLHALHVMGGVVPLAVIAVRAQKEVYSSSRSEPIRLTRRYWDFLLVVWLILIAVLAF